MTIQEMYAAIDSDFDQVLGRLMKESLITRLVLKYKDDKNFEMLCDSLAAKNYEEAFTAGHTLKGITANLGFTALAESSSAITEALRASEYEHLDELLNRVRIDHEKVVNAIDQLDS